MGGKEEEEEEEEGGAPCAQNDKINVLHEPYFGTHILGNHLPFQTSEIPKKNTKPLISIRGLAFDKLLQSSEKWKFHSFKVSLRETLAWVGSKPNFTIMICDFVCNVCGKQFNIIESMHLKEFMAISSVIERCRHQTLLKNNKEWWNIWTATICDKVLSIHCFSLLCFHVHL